MRWIILIVIFLVAYYFSLTPNAVPEIELAHTEAGEIAPCEGRDRCVSVYLTPWCSVCKRSKATFEQIESYLAESGEAGFKTVIGQDEAAAVNSMAAQYRNRVWLDYEGEFSDKMMIQSYPTWIVWDRNRVVTKRFSGAPSAFRGEGELRSFLQEYLGLQ